MRWILVLAILGSSSGIHSEAKSFMFVLDASGSMNDRMNGSTRMKVAIAQLERFVQSLPKETKMGLVAYGNRIPGCESARLYSPLKHRGGGEILAKLPLLFPAGSTPIARTLQLINKHSLTGNPNTEIILISDGIESCDGDPVLEVKKIQVLHPGTKIHVLGLDVPSHEEKELQYLAESGSGKYFSVRDKDSMNQAFRAIWSDPKTSPILVSHLPYIRITEIQKNQQTGNNWEYRIFYEYESFSERAKDDHTAMVLVYKNPSQPSTDMPDRRVNHPKTIEKIIPILQSEGKGKGSIRVELDENQKFHVSAELWDWKNLPRAIAISESHSLDSAKKTPFFDKIFR